MREYTISKLAADAGVSVHVIRDYERRGLLHPCRSTPSGYRIYDQHAVQRLEFILAGKAANISLGTLADLCRAIDSSDNGVTREIIDRIQVTLDQHRCAITQFGDRLACMAIPRMNSCSTAQGDVVSRLSQDDDLV
ncbi:MAG TPA: mercuric resistance transcriptional repressor MerD [Arenicellales bacterium]|nr:mercuric resistance transcriptional repressor MerD [Arenicellales bacterium]